MAHREPAAGEDPTIGKLVGDAFEDIGILVRSIVALAKSELRISLKTGGIGLVLFAMAGFIALLAVIMGSVAIAYFIHMADLGLAWCFLIVFGGYLLLAVLLALLGFLKIRKVRSPQRTIAAAQDTRAVLSHAKLHGEPAGASAEVHLSRS